MYRLSGDLSETDNLSTKDPERFQLLNSKLTIWEKETVAPLWTEGAEWDTITWMIHQDLMLNREIRAKDPSQLKRMDKPSNR